MGRLGLLHPLAPLVCGFLLLAAAGGGTLLFALKQQEAADWARQTVVIVNQLNAVQALATDAETGQRGFVLTGRLDYLEPFNMSKRTVQEQLDRLQGQLSEAGASPEAVAGLRRLVSDKLDELQSTIDLRAAGRLDDALAVVNKDTGKRLMDSIRDSVGRLRSAQTSLLDERTAEAIRFGHIGQGLVLASLLLMIGFAWFAVSDARQRILALQAEATERKAAEAQLRHFQKMQAVGQLTGGVAHDFNNMLAIVTGFLDLGRRHLARDDKEAVATCLDRASEGAQRAISLTRRLLAFSRQQPLEPRVLDANSLVNGMSELLRRTIGEAIGIETVLAGGLWKTKADAAQLENALVNLVINARDAMPSGGRLTIETTNAFLDERYAAAHAEVTSGQYVMLSVTDTGTGMPPATVERAFDPFFTTKEVGKGTGLGLSQVFGFVKQSGGHVKIYSEPGQGTSVKIYLPRHHGPVEETAKVAEARPAGGRASEVILVVEDEPRVRQMTVEPLRELGYTVVHADLPSEALTRLDAHPEVHLLLTDIVMPEMSGRELATRALAKYPDLHVVYATGYTRNAVVHNGIVDPGTMFLPKPCTMAQLGQKVRQALDAKPHKS